MHMIFNNSFPLPRKRPYREVASTKTNIEKVTSSEKQKPKITPKVIT